MSMVPKHTHAKMFSCQNVLVPKRTHDEMSVPKMSLAEVSGAEISRFHYTLNSILSERKLSMRLSKRGVKTVDIVLYKEPFKEEEQEYYQK